MCGVFEVSYTALDTKILYYKCGFLDNISFLFFRKIALPITILLFIVVMKKRGSLKRLKEKFGGSRITKSGSYNTNKSIIHIDITIQGRSSRGT
jgi:hypothetical protein